jgi:hypothetical protein
MSEDGKYTVTFVFSGEVICDYTDGTSYVFFALGNTQTHDNTLYKVPYSDFSVGSIVEGKVTVTLDGGDYHVSFRNGNVSEVIYN